MAALPFPRITRTSASVLGTVRHLQTAESVEYSEYIYGAGMDNYVEIMTNPIACNWIRRLIELDREQRRRIAAGERIPNFYPRGVPGFVSYYINATSGN
jgi:hypothetical protein